jgi:hypothetical protein
LFSKKFNPTTPGTAVLNLSGGNEGLTIGIDVTKESLPGLATQTPHSSFLPPSNEDIET